MKVNMLSPHILRPALVSIAILISLASDSIAQSVPIPGAGLTPPSQREITLGESFSFSVRGSNSGESSNYGSISVSFPSLTKPSDITAIGYSGSAGSTVVHKVAGQDIYGEVVCGSTDPFPASYLLVELYDTAWQNGERHELSLTVQPRQTGSFRYYYRVTMQDEDDGCWHSYPASSSLEDQQGWPVQTGTVTVTERLFADLVVSEITVSDEVAAFDLVADQPYQIEVELQNFGSGEAGSSHVEYYLGKSQSSKDIYLDDDFVIALQSNSSTRERETFYPTADQTGSGWYLVAYADSDNEVDEAENENNNARAWGPFSITEAPSTISQLYGEAHSPINLSLGGDEYTLYEFGNDFVLPFTGHNPVPTKNNLVPNLETADILYRQGWWERRFSGGIASRTSELMEFIDFFDPNQWWHDVAMFTSPLLHGLVSKRKVDRVQLGNFAFWAAKETAKARVSHGTTATSLLWSAAKELYDNAKLSHLNDNMIEQLALAQEYLGGDLETFRTMESLVNMPAVDKAIGLVDRIHESSELVELAILYGEFIDAAETGDLTKAAVAGDKFLAAWRGVVGGLIVDETAERISEFSGFGEIDEEISTYAWLYDAHHEAIFETATKLEKQISELSTFHSAASHSVEDLTRASHLYDEITAKYFQLLYGLLLESKAVDHWYVSRIGNADIPTVTKWWLGFRPDDLDYLANVIDNNLIPELNSRAADWANYGSFVNTGIAAFEGASTALHSLKRGDRISVKTNAGFTSLKLGVDNNVPLVISNHYDIDFIDPSLHCSLANTGFQGGPISGLPAVLRSKSRQVVELDISVPIDWFHHYASGEDEASRRATIQCSLTGDLGSIATKREYSLEYSVTPFGVLDEIASSVDIARPGQRVEVSFRASGLQSVNNIVPVLAMRPDGRNAQVVTLTDVNNGDHSLTLSIPEGPFGAWGIKSFVSNQDGTLVVPPRFQQKVFFVVPQAILSSSQAPVTDWSMVDWNTVVLVSPRADSLVAADIANIIEIPESRQEIVENWDTSALIDRVRDRDVILVGGVDANPLVARLGSQSLTKEGDATIDVHLSAFGSGHAIVVAGWSLRDTEVASLGFLNEWESREISLPVALAEFNVVYDQDAVVVSWTTFAESDTEGFRIEHDLFGDKTEIVHVSTAVPTRAGIRTYNHRFKNPVHGVHTITLFNVDSQGIMEKLETGEVVIAPTERLVFDPVYPNPAKTNANIRITTNRDGIIRIVMFDLAGRKITTIADEIQTAAGSKSFSIATSALPNGVYFIKAYLDGSFIDSRQLVVTK